MGHHLTHRARLAARLLLLLGMALTALVAEAPVAIAQWGDSYDAPDSYAMPPRRRARDYYRDDGYSSRAAPRRTAPPQQETRQFYWPWEDRPQQQQVQPSQPAPRGSARTYRPRPPATADVRPPTTADGRPTRARRATPPPVAAPAKEAPAEKTAPETQVAVFGDSLASHLAKGLDDAFAENANVAIVDKSRGDSGLVRKDVVDWPKAVEEHLKANPKTAYALVMVGVNDRQAIRENGDSYEPLSDKWREIYGSRVDALIKVFTEQKIPLIWVDVPPVRFDSLTKDLAAINDLVRERVQKAGQTYVDIWPAFVDDRNRFTANGPDLDGQQARLRAADGIHFTNAGARKLAHFADVELKRLMAASGSGPVELPAPVATTPGTEGGTATLDDTAAIDRKITAMLPSLPEPPGIPTLPVKPTAGPVMPLGRAETSPGGALLTGRPREGDAMGTVERAMQRGIAPTMQPGRADDFKWPPG